MWVLFYFVNLNVSHLLWSLDLDSSVALWRTMVVGAVSVGMIFVWMGLHPIVVALW